MSPKETLEKAFIHPSDLKKQILKHEDLDHYIRDNINQKMPLDGPLFRVYTQKSRMEGLHGKPMYISIIKFHHSLCDGVSMMSFC